MYKSRGAIFKVTILVGLIICLGCQPDSSGNTGGNAGGNTPSKLTILNVSYDPTREFYTEFNQEFEAHWLAKSGQSLSVDQSHGGGGKQARAVIDGLKADVVTLALSYDINQIAEKTKAFLSVNEFGPQDLDIVIPSMSIIAEPPVTVVDENAKANNAFDVATAYLEYLYSPVGQKLAAKHFYRPFSPEHVDPAVLARFPKLELFSIDEVFGGWTKAQTTHFNDGGVFDRIDAVEKP